MASIALKVRICFSLKNKSKLYKRERQGKLLFNCTYGLNCECISFVGKSVLNNTKEINDGESHLRRKF